MTPHRAQQLRARQRDPTLLIFHGSSPDSPTTFLDEDREKKAIVAVLAHAILLLFYSYPLFSELSQTPPRGSISICPIRSGIDTARKQWRVWTLFQNLCLVKVICWLRPVVKTSFKQSLNSQLQPPPI
ncbi:hypothetical protein AFLA_000678 [Aspergillus flavus NRRL3357]|nr:hypothetical protein AFLA_000678 [Aspergillus flavus NRRL3357]